MTVTTMKLGPIQTNCYLLCDEDRGICALVDPGDEGGRVVKAVQDTGLTLQYVLLTHSHFDHTQAIPALRRQWPDLPVYVHPDELADESGVGRLFGSRMPTLREMGDVSFCGEGDEIPFGDAAFQVLHTPGHSRGSVVYRLGDLLFTGDTLFKGDMGRTDLPGGSEAQILDSLRRLHDMPGDFTVYPGHEGASTLAAERKDNYCIRYALAHRP